MTLYISKLFFTLILLQVLYFSIAQQRLTLATTTSTDNSGLLAFILPEFEEAFDTTVRVIAVGTGAALKLAEQGNADVVLVHAPTAEKALMETGAALNRRYVFYNDFIILGPTGDPFNIHSAQSTSEAMTRLYESGAEFISRGDDSGTHKKELSLWADAGLEPSGDNYLEVGQGMQATLILADERLAYVLTDRGTYLAIKDKIDLEIVYQDDPPLHNPYHIMAVSPQLYPEANYYGAMNFIAYLSHPDTQEKIASFQISGEQLFKPAAGTILLYPVKAE